MAKHTPHKGAIVGSIPTGAKLFQLLLYGLRMIKKPKKDYDPFLKNLLRKLNSRGYITSFSCSGVFEDHPGEDWFSTTCGYIAFEKQTLAAKKIKNIETAALKSGLEVDQESPEYISIRTFMYRNIPMGLNEDYIQKYARNLIKIKYSNNKQKKELKKKLADQYRKKIDTSIKKVWRKFEKELMKD